MNNDLKNDSLLAPGSPVPGSGLTFLGFKGDYVPPPSIQDKDQVSALFSEIELHDDVDNIYIKTNEPITIDIPDGGVGAITPKKLTHREVSDIVTVLYGAPSITTRLSSRETVDFYASIFIIKNKRRVVKRYRCSAVNCEAKNNESGFHVVLRPIPEKPLSYKDINLPLEFVKNCIVPDGIVIIAGATGQGKSTTLAAVLRYIMEHETILNGNGITYEDPIEVSYSTVVSEHTQITQSGIGQGSHIATFRDANRAAMRRAPGFALIGEMRDADTVNAAIELAQTGHPVFATVHADNVATIVKRLIDLYPQEERSIKMPALLSSLRFLVSQKLIRDSSGKRMAIRETLEVSKQLRNLLEDVADNPKSVYQLMNKIMATGVFAKKIDSQYNYIERADRVVKTDKNGNDYDDEGDIVMPELSSHDYQTQAEIMYKKNIINEKYFEYLTEGADAYFSNKIQEKLLLL